MLLLPASPLFDDLEAHGFDHLVVGGGGLALSGQGNPTLCSPAPNRPFPGAGADTFSPDCIRETASSSNPPRQHSTGGAAALADKTARTAWAPMKTGEAYRAPKPAAT